MSSEALHETLSMLAVAKPSLEDCIWVKAKATEIWEFSGADRDHLIDSDDSKNRSVLIGQNASTSILATLQAMTRCAVTGADTTADKTLVEAVSLLLRILRNLARDKDESCDMVQHKDAARFVRDSIVALGGSSSVVCRDGFGVLTNFAVPPDNRQRILTECGAILVAFIKKHASDVQVAQNGCACLMNLANDVTHLDELGTIASLTILEVGMLHSKNDVVAEHVESALSALLVDRDNAARFLDNGSTAVIELIVNLIRLHVRDAVVCEHGLRSIYSLAQVQEIKPVLQRCGCLSAIQLALGTCPFPSVAEWACKALRAFSHNNADFKRVLYDAGAVSWIIEAVRAHGTTSSVAKAGLAALWSLANLPRNKTLMVNSDQAHIAVINAMRLVPDSAAVAVTGIATLASLAIDASVRRRMFKDGTVVAVMHAMKSHPGSALVCEHGCSCLWSLCMDKEVQVAATRDGQAAKTVLDCLTVHPNKPAVLTKALGALENLGASEQGANVVVATGAVPVLASLLRVSLQTDGGLVLRCCNVLATVAYFCDDTSVFQRYQVAEIAIEVQRTLPGDERCGKAAERLLSSLEGERIVPT